MELQRLRDECEGLVEAVVTEVGLPRPWSINAFLDRLEPWHGREIDLCAVRWAVGESTGGWQRRGDHDVIAYPENTTGAHQDHIICHELGHMLQQHEGQCVLSVAEARAIAPSLSLTALGHLLQRADQAQEERDAERFATLLLTYAHADASRPATELGRRVEATFGL
ncbi:hypothetical protein [Prauserella endophytica]|uniref:IrrE N-terminal-like domain-containing protein n=1 Tax=Prauserella endophytica TaxID=1592324 RepID=A0ABY2RUX3_9PSEU|nr:hypothetical protein [Prauserella endophytica]TKG61506.1 hypothetical protein FCN18_33235 [Prauserella endophytica]